MNRPRYLPELSSRNRIKPCCWLIQENHIRHMDHPFGLGIAVLDDSEAITHYIALDSADLSNSPTDIPLNITDHSVALDILRMLDSMWKHAQPIEMAMRRLTPILKGKVYVKFERQTNTSKYGSFASIPMRIVSPRKC